MEKKKINNTKNTRENPIVIYNNEDGTVNLSVFIENDNVWLSQKTIAYFLAVLWIISRFI